MPRARVISSRTVYEGRVVTFKVDEIVEPGGVRARREVVVHPGSVVVIPRLADGRIVLVRQYRYAARQSLWELVAGGLDGRETVISAARRELLEETGYRSRRMRRLLSFYPSPGVLTERMHLVEARDLTLTKATPEEDERIEVGQFRESELRRMLQSRRISDGKTLVGLMWIFQQGARPQAKPHLP